MGIIRILITARKKLITLNLVNIPLALLLILPFTGCTTGGVSMGATPEKYGTLDSKKGYFVVRVINAGDPSYPSNQITFAPIKDELKDKDYLRFSAYQSVDIHRGVSVYFGELPPGEYKLSSLRYYFYFAGSINTYSSSKFIQTSSGLGRFSVEPGKLTDLGSLIHFEFEDMGYKKEIVSRIVGGQDNSIVDRFIPQLRTWNDAKLGWSSANHETIWEEQYQAVLDRQNRYTSYYRSSNQNLYLGAYFGKIFKLDTVGRWSSHKLDTNYHVTKIAESNAGLLASATIHGEIFVQGPDRSWHKTKLDAKYRDVLTLSFQSNSSLMATVAGVNEVSIFDLDLDDISSGWTKKYSFHFKRGWYDENGEAIKVKGWKPYKYDDHQIHEGNYFTDEEIVYLAFVKRQEIYFDEDKYAFDLSKIDSGVIHAKKLPKFSNLPKQAGVRTYVRKWSGLTMRSESYHYGSDNDGDRVKVDDRYDVCPEIENKKDYCPRAGGRGKRYYSFQFVSPPKFVNEREAWAFVFRENKSNIFLIESKDGGARWIKSQGKVPKHGCGKLLPSEPSTLLVSCENRMELYESKDRGLNWTQIEIPIVHL